MGIISFALHGPLRLEEMLGGSLALHLAFFKHFTELRCFLLEKVQIFPDSLVCLVSFSGLRLDIHEELLLDSMPCRWSFNFFEDWAVHV